MRYYYSKDVVPLLIDLEYVAGVKKVGSELFVRFVGGSSWEILEIASENHQLFIDRWRSNKSGEFLGGSGSSGNS